MSTSTGSGHLLHNDYWVVPGRFAAGEYPGAKDPSEAASKVRNLLDGGVDHFVDLTEPHELVPYSEIVEEEATRLGRSVRHAASLDPRRVSTN